MITKSPSGALSPYYYKGGYFHAIHYGDYFDDTDSLLAMMREEEEFILKSSERRRILIDIYQTNLSKHSLESFKRHVEQISPRIVKLAIISDRKSIAHLHKELKKLDVLGSGQLFFGTDMEEGKTWLVTEA